MIYGIFRNLGVFRFPILHIHYSLIPQTPNPEPETQNPPEPQTPNPEPCTQSTLVPFFFCSVDLKFRAYSGWGGGMDFGILSFWVLSSFYSVGLNIRLVAVAPHSSYLLVQMSHNPNYAGPYTKLDNISGPPPCQLQQISQKEAQNSPLKGNPRTPLLDEALRLMIYILHYFKDLKLWEFMACSFLWVIQDLYHQP